MNTLGEAVSKLSEDSARMQRISSEQGGKIEARLESLAKMYESKKAHKDKKDTKGETANGNDNYSER